MSEPAGGSGRILERSGSMAWQTIDGETVLLNIDGKELMGLNEVGAHVWDLVDGSRSFGQIVDAVASRFEVSSETATADVHAFVSELVASGALAWKEGT
jgi:coenzyme PQQ synthesis protein D (PqqD)